MKQQVFKQDDCREGKKWSRSDITVTTERFVNNPDIFKTLFETFDNSTDVIYCGVICDNNLFCSPAEKEASKAAVKRAGASPDL